MTTITTNLDNARHHLNKLTDDIVEFNDQVIITKPNSENVVIMSEDEFRSWKETLYLLKSEENRQALNKSIDQLKSVSIKTLSAADWHRLND